MSNQTCFERSITAKIRGTLFSGIVMIFLFACVLAPASTPERTLDSSEIATYAFETALVLNTQAAASPTMESTLLSTETQVWLPTETVTQLPQPTATNAIIPVTGGDCIPNNPPQTGMVVDVVDGDTIKVLLDADGKTYSVRYIGMDTPEYTSQIEFFGSEAAAKNSELVYGKTVMMFKDISETDQYGRLLRYVIADDFFVNYELVAQGYANTASYPPDIACIPTFQTAEGQASSAQLGLWGAPPTQVILLPLSTAPSSGSGSTGGNAPAIAVAPTWIVVISKHMLLLKPAMIIVLRWGMETFLGWMETTMTVSPAKVCLELTITEIKRP